MSDDTRQDERIAALEGALRLCDDAIAAGVAELPRGGYTGGGERMYSETWRNFHRAREAARSALAGQDGGA